MNLKAIARARYTWRDERRTDVTAAVEQKLTWTGFSVIVGGELIPVMPPLETWDDAIEVSTAAPLSRVYTINRNELYSVAPVRYMIVDTAYALTKLDSTFSSFVTNGKITRLIGAGEAQAPKLREILSALQAPIDQPVPVLPLPGGADDISVTDLGDGNLHADEVARARNLILANFCQSLGVHTCDGFKSERLLSDEGESIANAVDLIARDEYSTRRKVALALNLEVLANAVN